MKGIRAATTVALFAMLMTVQVNAQAQNWVAINDELYMDPDSVTPQGELRKVTIKLKGGIHNILIFCKKQALLFDEKMIAASETPAGTSLVTMVCEKDIKWYEIWK
jgi:hypothetical protein